MVDILEDNSLGETINISTASLLSDISFGDMDESKAKKNKMISKGMLIASIATDSKSIIWERRLKRSKNTPSGIVLLFAESSFPRPLKRSRATRSTKASTSSSTTIFRETSLSRVFLLVVKRSFPSSIYDVSPQVSWPTGLHFIRRRLQ